MSRKCSSSRCCSTYRYCMRTQTSEVDETLFGRPKPVSSQLDKCGNLPSKAKTQPKKKQDKNLICNVRVPLQDHSGDSIILPLAEFERLTLASRVPTTDEKRKAQKEAYQRKVEEMKCAEERKRQIFEADLSRKENHALTELELEAQKREQHLTEWASALKMEQEDEIKKLNQLILSVQCQAIREAQTQEKKQIQEELAEEEKRLDAMMEVERHKALETEKQIDELRRQNRLSGMQQIYDQIQKHLEDKKEQEDMKENEKQQIQEKYEKMHQEDLKALEKTRKEQLDLQKEIMRVNAETMWAKEQRREEEKLADTRDMEYLRNKQKREAEYAAEQRRIREERELRIAKLRTWHEKATDSKGELDELRARRDKERADREWRRKEKELAAKKAQDTAMLKAARLEQVRYREHSLSIEAGREKAEFERMLKVQQEAIIKQKEEEQKRRQRELRDIETIRCQMKDHQLSAAAQRREMFREANRLVEEARQRRMHLNEIKEKKLKELRATGVPEKYCSDVERNAQALYSDSLPTGSKMV